MRTRVVTVLSMLMVIAVMITGCAPVVTVQQGEDGAGSGATAEDPVELTVRAFSFQLKPDRGRAGDQLRAWAAAHPNVKLTVQSVDDYNGDVLATDVAAGTAPDLVFAEGSAVQSLLTSGALMDLSPWYDMVELEQDFLPDYWNNFMSYEDKLYGVYQDTEARVVYYRPDFLAEAGLTAPTNGWTYAEMREYAKQLTTADRAGMCIGKEGYIELAMVVANGLKFGEDFTYDNDAVRSYYQFLADLVADGSTPAEQVGLTRDQCAQLFAAGKAGMIFLHSNGITTYTSGAPALLTPEQIGVVSLPVANAGEQFGTFGGGFMWVVPAKEYTETQLAYIKDLLQYMTSKDSQVSYALFRGFLLARKSYMDEINRLVVEDPGVSSSVVGIFYPAWIEIAQHNLTSIPRNPNTTVYRAGLAAGLEAIQAGQSVDDAVQAAEAYYEANKK